MAALQKLQIAVIAKSSRGFGREVLAGIAQHSRLHRNWTIFHDERVILDPIPQWLTAWNGDGILAGIESKVLADFVRDRKLPAVDIHGLYKMEGVPIIRPDHRAVARIAYDHLREVGFKRFAFCGFAGVGYSHEREAAYCAIARSDGAPVSVLNSRYPHEVSDSRIEADGFIEQDALIDWITRLEKPCGVFACNDLRGAQVLNACRSAGLSVPDEVGVIGADNDDCVCGMCDPLLTSIDLNATHIGFLAAETISALVQGRPVQTHERLVAPAGVIPRHSTSMLMVEDRDVARAMQFIRENASAGIGVNEVVGAVLLSRSTLERRFRRLVGRSIKVEINRHRLAHIKDLLTRTDFPIGRIADLVGFSSAEYLIAFFRKSVNMTPGEYRKSHSVWDSSPQQVG